MHDDFVWFEENYRELQEQYGDSFLAIKNRNVIGVYDSYAAGVRETQKTEPIGTFIIQQCMRRGDMCECRIASMNFA